MIFYFQLKKKILSFVVEVAGFEPASKLIFD